MVWAKRDYDEIPGTYVFDGRRAMAGYAINKMCVSFNSADNRAAFKRDPDAYCRKYKLSAEQAAAIKNKDFLGLLQMGGNIYYLAKLATIYGLNVQDAGAQQTGMTVEAFKQKLLDAAKD